LLAHELTHVVQQTGGSGQSSHKGRSTSGRSLHQDSGSSGAAASIRPAVQRIDAVQRAAKPWEEVGLTEDEWRKRVQEKRNAMAGMLGATVLQPGTTGTINSTSPQNVTSPSPPDTTSDTDQTQSDEDYIRQQQEKYRPPKEELEKLLKGAERIIAQQRAPQTPKATGSGVLSKVKGFFSGITGRLSKRKKVDPIPEPPPLPTQSSPPGLQRPKAPVDTRSLAEQLQSERLSRGMTAMEMPTAIGQGTQPSSRWEKFKTKASSFFSGFKTKAGGALSWAKSKVAGGAKGFRRGVYFNKPTSTDSVARGQDSSVTPSMPPPSTQVPTLPGRGSGYVAPNQRDLRPQDGTSGSPPQTSSDEGATDRGKDMEVRILTLERDLKDLQLQINQLAQKAKV